MERPDLTRPVWSEARTLGPKCGRRGIAERGPAVPRREADLCSGQWVDAAGGGGGSKEADRQERQAAGRRRGAGSRGRGLAMEGPGRL